MVLTVILENVVRAALAVPVGAERLDELSGRPGERELADGREPVRIFSIPKDKLEQLERDQNSRYMEHDADDTDQRLHVGPDVPTGDQR